MQEIEERLTRPQVYPTAFPPQDGVQQWTEKLQFLAMQSQVLLEQLSWLLQCCPSARDTPAGQQPSVSCLEVAEPTQGPCGGAVPDPFLTEPSYPSPVPGSQLPSVCRMQKQDQLWQESHTRLTEMLKSLQAVKADMNRIRQQSCETLFYSW